MAMFFEQPPFAFRIKVCFDSVLNQENAYVFVSVANTPTIRSFVNDLRTRFEIDSELRVRLKGVRILPSENILILADVNQIDVIPEAVETVSPKPLTNFEKKDKPAIQSPKECTEPVNEKPVETVTKDNSKHYPHRGIANFLQHLRENDKRPESKFLTTSKVGELVQCKKDENHINGGSHNFLSNKDDNYNKDNPIFETREYGDISDNSCTVESKRQRRKRRHSKKSIINYDGIDEIDESKTGSSIPIEFSTNTPQNVKRKHIYFKNDDNFEKNDCTEGEQKIEETLVYKKAIDFVNSLPKKTQDSLPSLIKNSSFKFNHEVQTPETRMKELTQLTKSEFVLKPKPVISNTENENIFSTLIMMKQMKTPNQYNVTFSKTSSETQKKQEISRPITSNNTPKKLENCDFKLTNDISVTEQGNSVRESSIKNGSVENTSVIDNIVDSDEECKMILHFQISDDKILLKKNDSWLILNSEIAEKELPIADSVKGNQLLVFQVLFLKHAVWPTLSDLLYGRVLNFNTETNIVLLEIPETFINKIVPGNSSSIELPEGIAHISENVYSCDWIAIKNPRLLSS